ncbi:tyrosyl-DNA phosphodiesterase 2-like [Mercenaria mercenaria]|uniref:tyrosyl-DNA phosphodiesterase 2-like n=1 Tax=Mercenaria mercenaria TaxID=6596 RepID=UPI00234EA710|nr:tyrosyl-DNA phosphodiesterase 2-like [Mercenaria mercenaria]
MSSSNDESTLPSAAECDKRCQEFAAITGTDTALAMFYLQDRDWSLDRALNSYFEEAGASQSDAVEGSVASSNNNQSNSSGTLASDDQPFRIRLLSWNIDGLDRKNLRTRTLGVCDTIIKEDPHVVFLQEVVQDLEEIIQEKCPMYHMIPGNDEEYYCAMLLKTGQVQVEETKILPFPNTSMLRNLLAVKCTVKGEKLFFMTSHLESTKDYSAERKEQLRQCLSYLKKREAERTVVFGGDLNLRDNELVEIGGLPEGVFDIWEVTGKRPEAKFTWDIQRNDNLEWSHRYKPKCRFDRLYVRHSEPKVLKPEYFELVGLERLKSCQRFCSDHWGLLTHFNILSKLPK